MKNLKFTISLVLLILGIQTSASAQGMQHGFILTNNDTFGSHLVANGHHSRQTEILGQLTIANGKDAVFYHQRKLRSTVDQTYFLFQAQQLDLPKLTAGMVLTGHIIESKIGGYEPQRVVVPSATFRVQRVLLNIPNPFFTGEAMQSLQPRHCCDTGAKPCNFKC